jgi:hypothetical protein
VLSSTTRPAEEGSHWTLMGRAFYGL